MAREKPNDAGPALSDGKAAKRVGRSVSNVTVGAETRRLLFAGRSGVLSTTMRGRDAWPYGSLVTYAPDVDGSPIFLFSTLSDHTNNLAKSPKASLLIDQAQQLKNPQRGPRATYMGTISLTKNPRHRRRYLARHPEAAMYAGFGDFGFYVMALDRIHSVGGFARARWLKASDAATPRAAVRAIQAVEEDIIAHMNADHGAAVDLYANVLLNRKGSGWQMIACDPWGLDLMRNGRFVRMEFGAFGHDGAVSDADTMRACLVDLAGRARAKR